MDMDTHDIITPETKPETEWLRGRAVQKMSPIRDHGRLQFALARVLDDWAEGKGEVAPEWRFQVPPPGEPARTLVPDISYLSNERLRDLTHDEAQAPRMAPDVAVEILSPGYNRLDTEDKIATLLRAGTSLVIVIDPQRRTAQLHDPNGVKTLDENATLQHSALPGFAYALPALFAKLALPS